ncbi:MAG: ABC transporter ATP-binding protein/permease [Magnetospirillum sp. WYHS-4]
MPPPADPSGPRDDLWTLKALLPYLWPPGEVELRVRVVAALVLLVAAKVGTVGVPLLLKQAVDALATRGVGAMVAVPLGLILAYGAVRAGAQLFRELQDALFAKVSQRAMRASALATFRHLHRLSLRFHLERQTGGLSRAIERGTRGIEIVLRLMLFSIGPVILEIGLVAAVLWSLFDARFALATLGTVALYGAWTLTLTEWRNRIRRRMNESDSLAHSKAIDSLLNYETVKYFGNEEHEARRFDQSLAAYESAAVRTRTSLALLNSGQGLIIAAGVTLVMAMAADGVADGRMTVGDFVLVNTYLLQLYLPLNFLGTVYREIKHALVDMESMFRLLTREVEVPDRPEAPALVLDGAEIVFDDVGFHYDSRRPILAGLSFTVPAGKTVALVGPSGGGKSTVAKLLFRFYDVTGGRILVDGQDLREVTQASLRAAIGIVPQDTVLFNDSIRYNIGYGDPAAAQDDIEAAARLAHIDGFVGSLPDGYATVVGERGLKLSGGEKQRVAIARTILKRPRILVFDEATSALDSRTEREIQGNLEEVAAGHTTLVIAHRLSTVVGAHEILVLEEGRIAERGTHLELLLAGGRYAEMWARQQAAAPEAG